MSEKVEVPVAVLKRLRAAHGQHMEHWDSEDPEDIKLANSAAVAMDAAFFELYAILSNWERENG